MAGQTQTSSSGGNSTASKPKTIDPIAATAIAFWSNNPSGYVQFREVSPWLICYLDDNKLPGIAKVDCSGQKRKIDQKDAPNQGNAKLTIKGYSPSTIKITITIWTAEHLQAWQDIKAKIRTNDAKNTSKTTSAVNVRNPIAEESNITAMIIENISGIDFDDKKGMATIVISGIEYAKPVAVAGGNGTGSNGNKDKYDWLVSSYKGMATACRQNKPPTPYAIWSAFCIGSGYPEYCDKPFPSYGSFAPYGGAV